MSENKIVTLAEDEPLNLDGGGSLSKFKTAYTTCLLYTSDAADE